MWGFEEALQQADIALAMNPGSAQALNSRGQALVWMGRDEDALDVLLSIPGSVRPELVEANAVFALLRLGRRDDALAPSAKGAARIPTIRAVVAPISRRCCWRSQSPSKHRR
jgi:hypothetical protein